MSVTTVRRRVRGAFGDYTVVGDSISKGGVGAIYRTSDPRWVYKEYLALDKAPDEAHLQRLVAIGRDIMINQALPIGGTPESSVNWPVDLTRAPDGRINGCVLPAIPDRFMHPVHGSVNTLDFLVMRRSRPPAAKARIIVLLRMAEILAFVNAKGLVHGDLNAKNVAWTLDPQPAAYLIDCDGMVPQNPPPTTGVQAVYWTDPRVVERAVPAHDHYSDWYCLALAFYRGLLLPNGGSLDKRNGVWPAPGQIPAAMDQRMAGLLRRALTDPLHPGTRPAPGEFVRTVLDVYVPGGRFDDRAIGALDAAVPTAPAPAPAPAATFVQVPAMPAAPPPMRVPPPARIPPPRQPPQQPPVHPAHHTYPQYPQYPQYPPVMYPPARQPGSVARWAMNGGAQWWVPLVMTALCCWPASGVLAGVVLVQCLPVDRNYPGRTAAIAGSAAAVGLSALLLIFTLASNYTASNA